MSWITALEAVVSLSSLIRSCSQVVDTLYAKDLWTVVVQMKHFLSVPISDLHKKGASFSSGKVSRSVSEKVLQTCRSLSTSIFLDLHKGLRVWQWEAQISQITITESLNPTRYLLRSWTVVNVIKEDVTWGLMEVGAPLHDGDAGWSARWGQSPTLWRYVADMCIAYLPRNFLWKSFLCGDCGTNKKIEWQTAPCQTQDKVWKTWGEVRFNDRCAWYPSTWSYLFRPFLYAQ